MGKGESIRKTTILIGIFIKYLFAAIKSSAGKCGLARMFHESQSRDHEEGRATGKPQGAGPEAYPNGTSQGATPEDARKNAHIRGRSR